MKLLAVMLSFGLFVFAGGPDDMWDSGNAIEEVQDTTRRMQDPDLSEAERARLEKERAERVDRIAGAGDRKPDDLRRQNEVARALTTVNEGARALPYAERTVELAEKTGKTGNISTALTTAAMAYQAAGRYEEAFERATRAVKLDPGNREALSVYHAIKGRVSSASAPAGGGAPRDGAAPATAPAPPPATAASAPAPATAPRPALALTSPERLKVEGYLAAARRAAGLGDFIEARRGIAKAAELAPGDAEVMLADAGLKRAGGDLTATMSSLDALLAAHPNHSVARLMRAETRAALGAQESKVLEDFLAAGGRQEDFSAFYAKTLAAIGAGAKSAPADASGKSAQASFFGRLKERSQDDLRGLLFGALAAVLVAVAALVALRRTRKAYHLDP